MGAGVGLGAGGGGEAIRGCSTGGGGATVTLGAGAVTAGFTGINSAVTTRARSDCGGSAASPRILEMSAA